MTDEQIIKALECCQIPGKCNYCPYHEHMACSWQLSKDAETCIKRLKARNQVLEKENVDLYGFKRQLEDELIERGWAEYANGDFRVLSDEERDKVRKETAKEILLDLKKDVSQCYEEYALSIVDEYIEKYGVEVEE